MDSNNKFYFLLDVTPLVLLKEQSDYCLKNIMLNNAIDSCFFKIVDGFRFVMFLVLYYF